MSNTPFMPLWVADFLADVQELDAREIGAYMLLLMSLWQRGGTLPDDQKKLQRVARVARGWPDVWAAIEDYFEVKDGEVSNPRLTKELTKARTKSTVNSENGARGGHAKALKEKKRKLANASDPPQQPYPESDTPPTDVGGGSAQKRASRLPDDWVLPIEWGRWALGEGWPELVIRSEAEKFRDYWHSASGQSSRKHDWFATWRNWMRKVPKQERGNGKRTLRDRVQRAAERHGELDRGEGGGGDVLRLPARFG